jgi:hypothetical protein
MGVIGGLPLMLLFIAVLLKAFSFVGQMRRDSSDFDARFMVWTLGASLFAHAATFISVSYFDQSFVFLYLTLAAISSAYGAVTVVGNSISKSNLSPILQKPESGKLNVNNL